MIFYLLFRLNENKYGIHIIKHPFATSMVVFIFNFPFDASTIRSIILLIVPLSNNFTSVSLSSLSVKSTISSHSSLISRNANSFCSTPFIDIDSTTYSKLLFLDNSYLFVMFYIVSLVGQYL